MIDGPQPHRGAAPRRAIPHSAERHPPAPGAVPATPSNPSRAGFQQSEEAALERDAQILALIGSLDEVLFEFAPDTTILNIWAMDDSLLVRPRSEMIGKTLSQLLGAEFSAPFEEMFQRVVMTGKGDYIEYSVVLEKGPVSALGRVTRMSSRSGAPPTLWMLARDITEQKRAEERERELSARILQTLDEERRHTSQFLHDTTVQNLVALKMNLGRALRLSGAEHPLLREVIAESIGLAEVSLQEVRTLSYLLYPPILDEAGLEPALRWYAKGFSSRSGIQTHVEISDGLGRFSRDVETAIFRIIQEALGNVHRHSSSLVAFVRLVRMGSDVVLEVEDQGKGMAAVPGAPAEGATPAPGIGIAGMSGRVKQLGGTFSISSELGKGTMIRATLPATAPAAVAPSVRRAAAGSAG